MSNIDINDSRSSETYAEAVLKNNPKTRQKISELLTKEEIKSLTKRSDLYGMYATLITWGGVAICFFGLALASQLEWYLALPLFIFFTAMLGGRQLAISLAVHDASHGTLFKTKWLNNTLADWLFAKPLWNDLENYRVYHFKHHTKTATKDDPDLILSAGYPTTKKSMYRKVIRDITGLIGLKYLASRVLVDLELVDWTVTGDIKWRNRKDRTLLSYPVKFFKNAFPMLVCNVSLFLVLDAFSYGWLYMFWVIAHITFFMLFARIRSMAEHAALEPVPDLFKNTRTTKAGLLARLTVAPLNVNFHQEHHIIASCSFVHLPRAHKLLREKGIVGEAPTYLDVLKIMSSANSAPVNEPYSG